jgi:hypothetical protein
LALGSGLAGSILGMIVPGLLSFVAGIVIFVIVLVKRRSRPPTPAVTNQA